MGLFNKKQGLPLPTKLPTIKDNEISELKEKKIVEEKKEIVEEVKPEEDVEVYEDENVEQETREELADGEDSSLLEENKGQRSIQEDQAAMQQEELNVEVNPNVLKEIISKFDERITKIESMLFQGIN